MSQRTGLLLAAITTASLARAQTSFPEVEPNETKATATPVACLVAGDSITGTTTGALTTAGAGSGDTFDVQTCALTPGIYFHRLTLTTSGTEGHIGAIRGISQTTGVPNTTTDTQYQIATVTTTPPRSNAWYGFGASEHVYYRVTGTASTTAAYAATLSTTPVAATPIPGATFAAGSTITISTLGQTTVDTELYVYDSNFQPVPTAHSDDTTNTQSNLVRTYAPGTYYLVVADFNIANNVSDANVGEGAINQQLIDFPNALCVRDSDSGLDLDFTISDGTTTLPVSATMAARKLSTTSSPSVSA